MLHYEKRLISIVVYEPLNLLPTLTLAIGSNTHRDINGDGGFHRQVDHRRFRILLFSIFIYMRKSFLPRKYQLLHFFLFFRRIISSILSQSLCLFHKYLLMTKPSLFLKIISLCFNTNVFYKTKSLHRASYYETVSIPPAKHNERLPSQLLSSIAVFFNH